MDLTRNKESRVEWLGTFLLKVIQRILNHLLAYERRIRGRHRVILIGIDHHIVLLACTIQCMAHLHRILEMYVIVGRTVHNQQLGAVTEAVGEVNRRIIVIACCVLLWQTVR